MPRLPSPQLRDHHRTIELMPSRRRPNSPAPSACGGGWRITRIHPDHLVTRQVAPPLFARRNVRSSSEPDDRLIEEVAGAFATLASAWKVEYDRWADEDRPVPPAMIVVCHQTVTAERVAAHIGSGEVFAEFENEPDGPVRDRTRSFASLDSARYPIAG